MARGEGVAEGEVAAHPEQRFIFYLKFGSKCVLRTIDLREKVTFEPIASLAALVVSSLHMVATSSWPRMEA